MANQTPSDEVRRVLYAAMHNLQSDVAFGTILLSPEILRNMPLAFEWLEGLEMSKRIQRSVVKGAVVSLLKHSSTNFEITVSGGPLDGTSESHSDYADALAAFEQMVVRVIQAGGKG